MNGKQERGSEEQDRVVNRQLRAVGDGWRGGWALLPFKATSKLQMWVIGEAFLLFKATSRLRMWVISEALLPFKATSRLLTWLIGVMQIIHPCCRQGEFLVHDL